MILVPNRPIPDPELFQPRDYQKPFLAAIDNPKYNRYLLVWHRRAGKDWAAMNALAYMIFVKYAATPIVAVAFAGLSKSQGGNILWDGRTNDGYSYIDVFPKDHIEQVDSRDFSIRFKNGSVFKIMTTRDPNVVRGMNPKLVLISEYDYIPDIRRTFTAGISPILQQNGGECIITTTPAGVKQTYELYMRNRTSPNWFCEIRGAKDTLHNGERVLTDAMIASSRLEGMSEAQINQEYFVDFFAESPDTFYEHEFRRIREQGRICVVPHDPNLPVHTGWDLGRDMTSIWFMQVGAGGQWNFIDYHHHQQKDFTYALEVLRKKELDDRYNIRGGLACFPHDFYHNNIRVMSNMTLEYQARNAGLQFLSREQFKDYRFSRLQGINLSRSVLDKCVFDAKRCFDGVEGLKHYKRMPPKMQDRHGMPLINDEPVHDDASHPADAFRALACLREQVERFSTKGYTGGTCGLPFIQTKTLSAMKRDSYGHQQSIHVPGSPYRIAPEQGLPTYLPPGHGSPSSTGYPATRPYEGFGRPGGPYRGGRFF